MWLIFFSSKKESKSCETDLPNENELYFIKDNNIKKENKDNKLELPKQNQEYLDKKKKGKAGDKKW